LHARAGRLASRRGYNRTQLLTVNDNDTIRKQRMMMWSR